MYMNKQTIWSKSIVSNYYILGSNVLLVDLAFGKRGIQERKLYEQKGYEDNQNPFKSLALLLLEKKKMLLREQVNKLNF